MILKRIAIISLLSVFQIFASSQIAPYFMMGDSLYSLENLNSSPLPDGQKVQDSSKIYVLDHLGTLHLVSKRTGNKVLQIEAVTGDLFIENSHILIHQDRVTHVYDTAARKLRTLELSENHVWKENTICVHGAYLCIYRTDGMIDFFPLEATDAEHKSRTIDSMYSDVNIHLDRIFSSTHGLIAIRHRDTHYEIKAYDDDGHLRFKTELRHTMVTKENNTHIYEPYLDLLGYTNDYIYFTDIYHNFHHETHFVGLNFGSVSEFGFRSSAGYLLDETKTRVRAMFFINETNNTLEANFLEYEWEADLGENCSDHLDAVLDGTTLIVADYNRIATGSNLRALNSYSGREVWKADVDQLMVGHSKYRNVVKVHLYKDKVILHGVESYGKYLQIFNKNTGEKLFSTIRN